MLKRIITLFLWLSFSISFTMNSALAAPGDILSTLTINNVSGDGRAPSSPHGITIHNGYIWVLDFGTDRIYRIYPEDVYDSDGITLLFNAGDSDFNIPVADAEDPPINSDGNPIGACDTDGLGNNIYCGGGGLTFAENFIWNATPVADNIYKIDPVDGDNLETENALAGLAFPSPTDMTFDGTHFWIADWQTNTISKVLPEDGTVLAAIPGPSTLPAWVDVGGGQTTANMFGLTWDGQALWATDTEEDKIYRINPNDGSLLNVFDAPALLTVTDANPKGLAWDGESLWHVDQSTATIYRLESGVIPFGIVGCVEKNGVAITGDVLLSQNAISDQATATDLDGCFSFSSFTSGVPLQVRVSETGVDEKPVLSLTGGDVTLIVGDTYSEPGVTAIDTEDGDISLSVVATPDVINTPSLIDTSTPNPTGQTITYNVIDSAGNAADPITRTVYVLEVDTTPPVITLNGDNPLYVEQASTYTELGAVAIDDRDGDISGSIVVASNVNTAIAGTYSVTYDVTDSTGNVATTVTRTVIVQDTTIPTISLIGSSPVSHERGDTYTDAGATAADNIDGDISTSIVTTGSVSQNTSGSYVITYDVADTAGNAAATVSRTINVADTTAPTITLIGAATYNQELNTSFVDPGVTATDYPGDDLTSGVVITGSVNTALAGSYVLTYDVSDLAGNSAISVIRTVVVADTTPPEITLLGDAPINHELNTAFTDPGATAADIIDGDITANIVTTGSVNTALAGTYTLTYNVSDAVGNNAATVTRDVIVADTTPPLITLNGLTTVNHEQGVAYADAGATASDIIDGDLTANIVVGGDTVDINVPGTYIITYNVSDAVGNAAAPVTRAVNIADRTIPVITLLGASPLDHEVGTIFNDPGATATDNIDGVITASIGVTGTVNASSIGSYTLTYSVQDSSGNAATTVARTVNVVDTGAPSITLIGTNPILHELQTPFTDPGATASDAADGDVTASIVTTGTVDSALAGTYVLTYNVSDSQSNAAPTVTRDVIVADRTAPIITLTGAATINHEQGTPYTDAGATAADIIDGDVTATIVSGGTVDSAVSGTYILTYNVSDAAGNAATQVTRTVTVVDTTVPVITLNGANPLDHEVGTLFTDPGATASDNIDGVITGNIGVTGAVDASTIGSYSLTYNVQDSSGNAAVTVTRSVNVVDTGAPSIALIGANPVLHELQTPFTDPGATASDAADGDVTASIITTGAVNSSVAGTYTLTYNVNDSQSNPAPTVTRDVIVADRTAPIITLTGLATLNHEQGTPYTDAGATAADIIDGDVTATIVTGGTVNSAVAGTYVLTYNVSDAVGNAATQVTRTVTVVDTTIPIITLNGANPLNHEVGTLFTDPGATASDNIDGVLSGNIGVTGTVDASTQGSYSLTYNVQDSSGNAAATVTRTVNVVDTGAPSIALIGANPILHELQTPFTDPGATASDAADGDLTASIIATGAVDTSIAGTYTLSYDVTDSQSNSATTVTRDVIVADRTAPVITLTGAATLNHEQGTSYTDAGATAADIIDGDVSINISVGGTVNSAVAGTYILNFNVSDAVGNAATQVTRTVTVVDTTAPVITLNGANPINHEVGTLFTDPGATASDNIDGVISGSIGVTGTVDASTLGSYSLTYNVQDSSGNAATTVTRTVNVVDTGAPSIALIGANPILHELQTPFTDPGATASDAADGNLTASIVTTGTVNSALAGTYTLTYNVNDSQSNPAPTVTRDVIVADRTAPVITLTGATNINIEQGAVYTESGATATDTIDGDVSASIVIGGAVNTSVPGTYVLTYNVSDAVGNAAAQVTRTVIVADQTAPVITLNGSNPIDHEVNTIFTDPGASATDNIDGNISSSIGVSGTVNAGAVGSYILTYNVSDSSGNAAATVTRTVNVADTGAPVISILGANPLNHELNTAYTDPGATASDAVDGNLTAGIVTVNNVNSNVAGSYTVTYDVSDSNSNAAATQIRTVNVGDFTAPLITLTGSPNINVELGSSYTDAGATASDNIDGNLTSSIVTAGSVNPSAAGTYIISYDVTDAAGNSASQVTRTVVVSDTTAPVLTLLGSAVINHEQGTAYSDPSASATDNTDGDITGSITVSGFVDANAAGTYILSYNVSDSAGNNATTVTRTVNVQDTIIPTLTLIGASPLNHEQGTVYADPGASANDSVDGDITASVVTTGTVNINTAGSYILTYNVSDTAGNNAAAITRNVIVADTTAPVITLTGLATVNHEKGSTYTDSGATGFDSVDGDITLSIVVNNTVNPNVSGSYTVFYDLTDAAGNTAATVTRTVVVADTIAPVISLTGPSTVNHAQGSTYTDQGATASDNFDGDISSNIARTGTVDSNTPGTYTLNYNVSDADGNPAVTVTRNVVVADTTAPVITLTGSATVNVEQGSSYVDAGATASDDVDGNVSGSIAITGDSVNPAVSGTYIIRYDVSDVAGNAAAQVIRTVIVADTTIPVISLVGSTPTNHQQGTVYTDAGATASDNTDGNITANIAVTGSVNENLAGSYTLTYNVSDAAGNAAVTVTRTVNVADTQAPTITILGTTPIAHEQGDTYTDAGATASDSVDGSLTGSITTVNNVNTSVAGSYTVTYDVTDAAGNAATQAVRTVNVSDTTIPIITLLGDSSIDLTNGTIFVDPGYSAVDNTDGDISANVVRTGSININVDGVYVLSYNVMDAGGNSAVTVTRTVNVVTPTTLTIEAETATIGGLHSVSTTNTGYLGAGYVEHSGEGYIEYTFDAYGVPYNLEVRYAWDTGDRPLEVILNSTSLGNLSFPATGGLTTWLNTATLAITPQSGTNTLRLSTTGLSGANIDQLIITPQ